MLTNSTGPDKTAGVANINIFLVAILFLLRYVLILLSNSNSCCPYECKCMRLQRWQNPVFNSNHITSSKPIQEGKQEAFHTNSIPPNFSNSATIYVQLRCWNEKVNVPFMPPQTFNQTALPFQQPQHCNIFASNFPFTVIVVSRISFVYISMSYCTCTRGCEKKG